MLVTHSGKLLFANLFKHYETISKRLLEMMFIILLNIKHYKKWTQQLASTLIEVKNFFSLGSLNVLIEKRMEKLCVLFYQQKFHLQLVTAEGAKFRLLARFFGMLKPGELTLPVQVCFHLLKQLIIFKSVIYHFTTIDLVLQTLTYVSWGDSEFNFHWKIIHEVLD